MKLFWQLTEVDQNNALHHCADIVVGDLIEEGVKIDPITDDDKLLKQKLEAAVAHIKTLATREEKEMFLMEDQDIVKAVYEIALEMCKSAFYMDSVELVIYPDALTSGEEELNDDDIIEEIVAGPKKDNKHTLN